MSMYMRKISTSIPLTTADHNAFSNNFRRTSCGGNWNSCWSSSASAVSRQSRRVRTALTLTRTRTTRMR
ncbi:unnamed protein product [Nippostrongylus brasiliensis]|uniref:Uncharacterized protein n=1 Tax=Nippostrongylus brasiliensis TaxID=27835 RepID=A0A0N4YZ72_NIPBR|nr:unnamed protein product [Nippostrongylus brasiliensis]